jgi:hypothetical protein
MLPAPENVCAGQAMQAEAPAAVYLPAWQLVQVVEALDALYVPGPHATHGPPAVPVYPCTRETHAVLVN